ncbi:hypothetical protein San01_61690 [Streptomyces angustmyceticus]|uniref:Hemerythrin-like domain-containing protein n=1 Tax=Streptomyces angustmyceticus TaxID=285578 RepID=A0A5J4LNT2_9ACTN|nr:hypothetical protein San01_61690 [Streptomyces angustmyceticus]
MRRLRTEVTAHVDDEENNLFLQMRSNVDAAVLLELGDKIRRSKKTAPTRPHPTAPDPQPVNRRLRRRNCRRSGARGASRRRREP